MITSEPVLHVCHYNDFSVLCIMAAVLIMFKHRYDKSGILPGLLSARGL